MSPAEKRKDLQEQQVAVVLTGIDKNTGQTARIRAVAQIRIRPRIVAATLVSHCISITKHMSGSRGRAMTISWACTYERRLPLGPRPETTPSEAEIAATSSPTARGAIRCTAATGWRAVPKATPWSERGGHPHPRGRPQQGHELRARRGSAQGLRHDRGFPGRPGAGRRAPARGAAEGGDLYFAGTPLGAFDLFA